MTMFVKFITNSDEHLGALSDSSRFSPFWWENLLKEVGEQWCSLVGWIGCHHSDIAMMALDPADWRAPLLAYLLEEVLPPKRTEVR